jgi:hypothetical protein
VPFVRVQTTAGQRVKSRTVCDRDVGYDEANMMGRKGGVYARWEHAVAGIGDEDEDADNGDEGADLRKGAGLVEGVS